jgi:hypothetical protein
VKAILTLAAVCLLLSALCGCENKEDKLDASPKAIGCAGNLRFLQTTKERWMQDQNADLTNTPTMDDLQPYFIHGTPKCPEGGAYTIGKISEPPQCSIAAHNDFYKTHMTPAPPAPAQ